MESRARTLDALIDRLVADYEAITPQIVRVREALEREGSRVLNDHIALRTFDRPGLGIDRLAAPFVAHGYALADHHAFPQKRVRARSYLHPEVSRPAVFVSELCTDELDEETRAIINRVIGRGEAARRGWSDLELLILRPTWPAPTWSEYLALAERSEYAAWLAAFGHRVNHVTVSFAGLVGFHGLSDVCAWLTSRGEQVHRGHDPVQGARTLGLEQCSTVAETVPWTFADGDVHAIPSCYVEFARRYVRAGESAPYRGFVTDSADAIFESTNRVR